MSGIHYFVVYGYVYHALQKCWRSKDFHLCLILTKDMQVQIKG